MIIERSVNKVSVKSTTILIVDVDETNLKLFTDLLKAHGYSTLQSEYGIDAISLSKEHRPALILMEMNLPIISGLEITRIIKESEKLKHIPVIATTAYVIEGEEDKFIAGGCDGYITQPIVLQDFLNTIANFIN